MTIPHGLFVGIPWQLGDTFAANAAQTLRLSTWHIWRMSGAPVRYAWAMDKGDFEAQRDDPISFACLLNEPNNPNEAYHLPVEAARRIARWQDEFGPNFAAPGVLWHMDGDDYLDAYLAAGGPVPEAWHIHIYAHDPADLRRQYGEFVDWMIARNALRPVHVTEGAAWGPKVDDQRRVMDAARELLDDDAWLRSFFWFSAHASSIESLGWWARSDLLDASGQLTALGEHFLGSEVTGAAGDVTYLPNVQVSA